MRYRLLAPIALIVLAAGACTASTPDAPKTFDPPAPTTHSRSGSPTRSSMPTSSPSAVPTTGPNVRPGEKPPTLPRLATKHSDIGAAEFARYWFEALDWGYATTSSALARTLYAPSCEDCARFMRNFDIPRKRHEHFRGGRSMVESVSLARHDRSHPGATAVDVTIAVQPLITLDAHEKIVSRAPGIPRLSYRLWLKWLPSGWRVIDSKRIVHR